MKRIFILVLFLTNQLFGDDRYSDLHYRDSSLQSLHRSENVTVLTFNINHLHYIVQISLRPRNESPRLRRLNAALRLLGVEPENSVKFGSPNVLVLTEVMSNSANQEVAKLVDIYPHQTPRLGNDCADPGFVSHTGCRKYLLNGGVKILSQWPILRADGLVFRNRINGDQLVNKGAIRAIIRSPNGVIFHIIGTHMQSTETELQKTSLNEKAIRRKELVEIVQWMGDLRVPPNETVILAGDFNIEFGSPEFATLLTAVPLSVSFVPDPDVGGSFSAKYRGERTNWLTAYHLYGTNVSQMDETLDYVTFFTHHRHPTILNRMEVLPVKSSESWSWWRLRGSWKINETVYYHDGHYRDLSDHYPVVQKFSITSD